MSDSNQGFKRRKVELSSPDLGVGNSPDLGVGNSPDSTLGKSPVSSVESSPDSSFGFSEESTPDSRNLVQVFASSVFNYYQLDKRQNVQQLFNMISRNCVRFKSLSCLYSLITKVCNASIVNTEFQIFLI